ncbi:Predicted P-loop ATPase [Yersinia enterocolitica]|uniref:KAP family P-loop NTPase fold protein n=1 Tax=Yersinia enterocolitica TaxID=630 RepID=UPI0005DB6DED|nr:KAP family NTPase [Yersinia enterocolitica]CNF39756.1 Predicted P-loop ATPase [Yersinia enterocolitica]
MINLDNKIKFSNRDEYKRKSIAEKIIKLITSDIDTSPMIIDGSWGTGKTEFCYKLINLLNERNPEYKTVYVDAFNEDHTDSPILTVLAAIVTLLPKKDRSAFVQKALPALRFGLKTTLKAGAAWVLKQDSDKLAEEFQDAMKETSNAAIDSTVEALLEDHINAEKNIAALRLALKEISKDTPIVIFIDELDRCKPNFAISILENIKHVFDVDNVDFVLVTNTQQLQASINHIYGKSVDAKRYLDKFIRFSFILSDYYKSDGYTNEYTSSQHWKHCKSSSKILDKLDNDVSKFIIELIENSKLSLREVETFSRYVELYQTLSDKPIAERNIFGYSIYKILAIYLYCFYKNVAQDLAREIVDPDVVSKALSINKLDYIIRDFKYPSHISLAFYGIIQEYISSSEIFPPPSPEQKKAWDEMLAGYFYGGALYGRQQSVISIMAQAIEVMQLK